MVTPFVSERCAEICKAFGWRCQLRRAITASTSTRPIRSV
jgi:hypothetical protein